MMATVSAAPWARGRSFGRGSSARIHPWTLATLVIPAVCLWSASGAAEGSDKQVGPLCTSVGGEGRVSADLCGWLGVRISREPTMNLVLSDLALSSSDAVDPNAAMRQIHEDLARAAQQFRAGYEDESLALYRSVVESLLEVEPWITDPEIVVEALLGLIGAELADGQAPWRADQAAIRLLNFSPGFRDRWRTSVEDPEVFALLQTNEHLLDSQSTGMLAIDGLPVGAQITVDGEFVGVVPVRIERRPGEHLVRARADGYQPTTVRVAVIAAEQTRVPIALLESRGMATYEEITRQIDAEIGAPRAGDAMGDLRSMLAIDQLIALKVKGQKDDVLRVSSYLYDLRSGQLIAASEVEAPGNTPGQRRAIVDDLFGQLTAAAALRSTAPDKASRRSVVREWWFWTSVGAVVLAGTVGTLVLMRGNDSAPPEPHDTHRPPPGTGDVVLSF